MWRLAVYKDAVVQLVHALSCSSTKASCLAEVIGPKPGQRRYSIETDRVRVQIL